MTKFPFLEDLRQLLFVSIFCCCCCSCFHGVIFYFIRKHVSGSAWKTYREGTNLVRILTSFPITRRFLYVPNKIEARNIRCCKSLNWITSACNSLFEDIFQLNHFPHSCARFRRTAGASAAVWCNKKNLSRAENSTRSSEIFNWII